MPLIRYQLLVAFSPKKHYQICISNKPLFADQLIQLTKIITTLIPSTSYLRNVLVKITGSFKAIWVKKGEDEKTGEHLSVVAKTVRAPKARVVEYLAQKEERLVQKLRDKYHESWENIEQNTRDLLACLATLAQQSAMEALCYLRSRPVADPEKANFSIPT